MSKAFCVDRFGEWQIARSLTHVRAAVGGAGGKPECVKLDPAGAGGRDRTRHRREEGRGEGSGGSAVFDRFSHNGIMGA